MSIAVKALISATWVLGREHSLPVDVHLFKLQSVHIVLIFELNNIHYMFQREHALSGSHKKCTTHEKTAEILQVVNSNRFSDLARIDNYYSGNCTTISFIHCICPSENHKNATLGAHNRSQLNRIIPIKSDVKRLPDCALPHARTCICPYLLHFLQPTFRLSFLTSTECV